MQNKLQELTDKLYNEGLAKGREEGEALIIKAKAEAQNIVEEARKQAESIISKAEKDAAELRDKTAADVRMASEQSLQATRISIENLITSKISGSKVDASLADIGFVKAIIKEIATGFSASENCDLSMVLSEGIKDAIGPWITEELPKAVGKGINATFSKKLGSGFTIGPADGSYYISFTGDSFKELISGYLRPATRKLLFGE